jgi:opacity protein-like surface antigen
LKFRTAHSRCVKNSFGWHFIILMGLPLIAGVASARTDIPWDGGYFGGNFGDASSSTCNSGALSGAVIDPVIASEFNLRDCSKSGALVGGVQFGENFQSKRLVWGIGADLDYWSAKDLNQSLKYSGAVPPAGKYVLSSKQSPSGFAVIGPRIGYAGDTWLPYLRVGTIIEVGSHGSTLFYTPTAATKPIASFGGGKNFATTGWVAGGGFELGLNGAWSIMAEYLHANLGKGSNSSTNCGGTVSACTAFSGISFDNGHEGFSANLFRVGITYWFGYW